jgi:ABC-type Fe3+/spermidine/putrescine transport system ATPase subunit
MRDGRIVQQGSPRELYERPTTRFLAEFLGETNFIPATIERSADGSAVLSTPLGTLSSAHVGERAAGTQVLLSVRTEAWTIDADGPVALPCIQSTYLGKLAQHELDARGLRLRVTELNPPVADRAGQTVRLSVDPMQVIVLDGA